MKKNHYLIRYWKVFCLSIILIPNISYAQLGVANLEIISRDQNGNQTDASSTENRLSTNGLFAVFLTRSSLDPINDQNDTFDIYLKDIQSPDGDVTLISNDQQGGTLPNIPNSQINFDPSISADGCQVAFRSLNPNLVNADTNNNYDVYVWDCNTQQLERVNVPTGAGSQSIGDSSSAFIRDGLDISPDGNFVVFSTTANDLSNMDNENLSDIYLYDRTTQQIQVISQNPAIVEQGASFLPRFSKDPGGCYITFRSSSVLINGVPAQGFETYVYNRCGPTNMPLWTQASTGVTGQTGGAIRNSFMAADGCTVVFNSVSELTPNDQNNAAGIYIRDICQNTIELLAPETNNLDNTVLLLLDIAGFNAQYIYLILPSPNLDSTFFRYAIFDRVNDQLLAIDTDANGNPPNTPLLSAGSPRFASMTLLDNGDLLASFAHIATNLSTPDTNSNFFDTFLATIRETRECRVFPVEDFGVFENAQCTNTTVVSNDSELAQYLTDFDFNPFGNSINHLEVAYNLSGDVDIRTPCSVRLSGGNSGVSMTTDDFYIFAREGVSIEPTVLTSFGGSTIRANNMTMVAENQPIHINRVSLRSNDRICLHNNDNILLESSTGSTISQIAENSIHLISNNSSRLSIENARTIAPLIELSSTGGFSGAGTRLQTVTMLADDILLEAVNTSTSPFTVPAQISIEQSSVIDVSNSVVIDSSGIAQFTGRGRLSSDADVIMDAGSFNQCSISSQLIIDITGQAFGVCADLLQ